MDPALSALAHRFEVYIITDACGDISEEANHAGFSQCLDTSDLDARELLALLDS